MAKHGKPLEPAWRMARSRLIKEERDLDNRLPVFPKVMRESTTVLRGRSSMVERQLPKLHTRVRFPSPAPNTAIPRCADKNHIQKGAMRWRDRRSWLECLA